MAGVGYNFTGGNAYADNTSAADNSQVLDFNPSLNLGSGTITASPSQSPSLSNPLSQSPLISAQPAGPGLATLNTLLPGAAGATTATSATALSSSTLIILVVIVGAVLLMPSGKR